MKNLLFTIIILGLSLTEMTSQVTPGLRIGASPSVKPGTSHVFVNRHDPMNESLFNIRQVDFSEQIGLMARLDLRRFWLMSELMYGRSNAHYSMIYTRDQVNGMTPTMMDEKRSYLELPLSLGVSLGMVEIFSGFNASYDLSRQNELENMEGFSSTIPAMHFGWHSGLGLNLGHVLLDVRYQQEFGNYGQGRYINGQELLLKNAPGRFIVTAGYRI